MVTTLISKLVSNNLFGYRGIVVNFHTLTAAEQISYLDLLGKHFRFISHDELVNGTIDDKRPFCLLTYDDGKLSNYQTIYPLLKSTGVPAIFYVTTEFISEDDYLLWFDRYRIALSKYPDIAQHYPISELKLLSHKERESRVAAILSKYEISIDPRHPDIASLSWDNAREMIAAGYDIGSHALYHEILPREAPEQARNSISESINTISDKTGVRCPSFCFPNGNYTDELAEYALECGVRTAVTTVPAWVTDRTEPAKIPRIQLHSGRSVHKALLKINLALLPGILENPDGTGRKYVFRK